MAHSSARRGISFDDINFEKNFNTLNVYGESKLANILHCKELSRRLENTGISVYSLHPGKNYCLSADDENIINIKYS